MARARRQRAAVARHLVLHRACVSLKMVRADVSSCPVMPDVSSCPVTEHSTHTQTGATGIPSVVFVRLKNPDPSILTMVLPVSGPALQASSQDYRAPLLSPEAFHVRLSTASPREAYRHATHVPP